jgi:Domain of Unknown Function (DUF748)
MVDLRKAATQRVRALSARTAELGRSSRMRKIGLSVLGVVALFGLAGFVGVPLLLRHIATGQLATALHRPVSVGKIWFNPYRLKLDLDQLHIGEPDSPHPFVDIGHIHVKVSWTSLFRLAPVVREVTIERPAIHVVRIAEQRFNFSDLLSNQPPAEKPSPPPSGKPFRFAISNIQIHDGELRFDDKVLAEQHAIEHVKLDVPFIANLPADVDIFVQPLLQMVVDGSPLRITGKAKPFAAPPESVVDLNLHRLDLSRYIGYAPAKVPVKLPKGMLSCALQVHFVAAPAQPLIRIGGAVALEDIDLRDGSNSPLLALKHAVTTLTDVEPLSNIVHLGRIRIDGLTAQAVLNPDGSTNLTPLTGSGAASHGAKPQAPAFSAQSAAPSPIAQSTATPAPAAHATTSPMPIAQSTATPTPAAHAATSPMSITQSAAPPAAQSTATAAPTAQSTPEDVALDSFELVDSIIKVVDNRARTPAVLSINGIHVGLKALRTTGQSAAPFDVEAKLGGGGSIAVKGALDLTKSQATTDISLDKVDLPALQTFAQSVLAANIQAGKLSAHANVRTNFATGGFNVHAEPASVSLDNFDLRTAPASEGPIQWNRLSASIGQVDLATRQATVNEVRADGMHLFVRRAHDGELNLASLVRTSASPSPQGGATSIEEPVSPPKRAAVSSKRRAHAKRRAVASVTASSQPKPEVVAGKPPASSTAQAWKYRIASVAIENTQLQVEDDTPPSAVKLAVAPLNLHLKDVSSDLGKPITLDLDGTVNHKGSFKITGTATPTPLKANVHVVTKRIDIAMMDPYVTSQLNATMTNAALSMNAALDIATVRNNLRVNYRGDATLGSVRLLDKLTNDSFMRWNALSASRINVEIGAGPPRVRVGSLALDDFYARVILNANGRINLSDISAGPQAPPTSLTRPESASGGQIPPAPTSPTAIAPAPPAAQAPPATGLPPGTSPPGTAAPSPPAATTGKPIPADIELGQITFTGGRVNYSDNFIKPNYSANLTDITGKVGAFGTSSTSPADVSLQGQVNGSSPIDINGSMNPLAPMAFVDLKAKANGIELTGLTAYSTKYTGYPIVKGTLTVDVHYLLNQGNLTADNHIFIDQLTFGDRVQSPTATNLPIRLAVALMKNSRGEIDVRVPVSGSLSDPHFSIGSVVLHAFLNLIVKAATSPFSLIASAFGGGGNVDLSHVEFAPGLGTLTPDSQNRLAIVAKALQDRPGLRLNISGRVDPAFDREGLREAIVARQVRAQKIKDVGDKEDSADSIAVAPDEYDKYLKRAYKAADFPKPRDLIGLDKSLPPDEMKKLMLTNTQVTDKDLEQLANARANVVRQWMSKKIDSSRLFVVAPKLDAKGINDKGKTTRADLSLQ